MINTKPSIAITVEEWQIVQGIMHEHIPNREVWAFGSRVKKTHKPFSDLDLAVMGSESLSLAEMADLSYAFSHSNLPFKVDVVNWATTDSKFQSIIQNHYVVLSELAVQSSRLNTE
jgi:predicted nucleotidyltransferase